MLRSEHVMARLYRGRLVPHRLSPDDRRALAVAEELCDLYAAHVGLTEIPPGAGADGSGGGSRSRPRPPQGFKIVRALSKLLEERAVGPLRPRPTLTRSAPASSSSLRPCPNRRLRRRVCSRSRHAGTCSRRSPWRPGSKTRPPRCTRTGRVPNSSATSTGPRRESSSVATTSPRYRGCSTRRGISSSTLVKGPTRGSCSTT